MEEGTTEFAFGAIGNSIANMAMSSQVLLALVRKGIFTKEEALDLIHRAQRVIQNSEEEPGLPGVIPAAQNFLGLFEQVFLAFQAQKFPATENIQPQKTQKNHRPPAIFP